VSESAGRIDIIFSSCHSTRLQSHISGLAYYDAASGKSVMIAVTKDAIGQLTAPNVVIYADSPHRQIRRASHGIARANVPMRGHSDLDKVHNRFPREADKTVFRNGETKLLSISSIP
jgi:hypothetical protein